MKTAGWIMPLATIDDVRAELADTESKLNTGGAVAPVCAARRDELRACRERWQARLRQQLEEMEGARPCR